MSEEARVHHIALAPDIAGFERGRAYRCASLDTEGFIHCCTAQQLPGVVERYYTGQNDLYLLTIAAEALDVPMVMENTVGGEELFPHVYGPIPARSIIDCQPFDPRNDVGRFPSG